MTSLTELVRAMSNPDFYPGHPISVAVVQTQMSFVFLTGDYVYKIKKPVDFGYVDYTTLEQRRHFCQREVTLNQRLCPDVYLNVLPITLQQGKYAFEGSGPSVECAVKMRQLPADRTLDNLLRRDEVTEPMLDGLAEKIASFHRRAATSPEISAFGNPEMIARNVEENFSQSRPYIGRTITQKQWDRLRSFSDSFLHRNAALFKNRVAQSRIRDCHGDLYSAHVCFSNGICIFDCIEFNDRFRYCDVAAEIAFLAMDVDYHGHADLSGHLIQAYTRASGDSQLPELLDFYKCYRAMVRAKVNCFKIDDPLVSADDQKTSAQRATRYFELAESYTLKTKQPFLIIMMGLVATGKSALAQAVAGKTGAAVISSDVTRKNLQNIPLNERHFDEFDSGLYSREMNRKTYDAMFAEARSLLRQGKTVIIDASFRKLAERRAARDLARREKAGFILVECGAPEAVIKERLARRLEEGSVSDGRWEVYLKQKTDTDTVSEIGPLELLSLDTTRPLEELTATVLNRQGWWEETDQTK